MNFLSAAKKHEDDLIRFTSQLVSIPTVNPPGDRYIDMVRLLERTCRSRGLRTRLITVPKSECIARGLDPKYPRISLLAEWDTGAKKWLHINGHYDVVPVTNFWKTKPFNPVLRADKLYGRGTADMKSDIAAALFAIRLIKDQGIVPKVNIQFSFVPDEETGGVLGMKYLMRKKLIKADYVIGEGHSKGTISVGNKGLLWMKVEVIGKSSHAAYAYKGINAFRYASFLAVELDRLRARIERRASRHAFSQKEQRHPTLVLGGFLSGGSKSNTVPDRVIFSIDRRILPDEDPVRAEQEILVAIASFRRRHPEVRIKVTVDGRDAPIIVDSQNQFVKHFSRVVTRVRGTPTKRLVLCGGTDLRFLLYRGIPGVGYSPDGENMHADNEYVRVRSMVETTAILAGVIAGMQSN
jgi:succinyl-diaminopimelate desuccinylase